MDIVLLFNGLGNQMSQYAFYLAKKQRDHRTRCIHYPDPLTCQHNGYELDRIFGIQPDGWKGGLWGRLLDAYLWSQVCDSRKRHWLRVIMKRLHISYQLESSYGVDNAQIETTKDGVRYLWGGWHCEDKFKEVETKIRQLYRFDENRLNVDGLSILDKIKQTESVSIHVRRGDFLTDGFGGICTPKYYQKAIAYIKSKVNDPHFFVFSDDLAWCRENLNEDHIEFVDIHHGKDSWKDMLLMSKCKHNLNSNSTFAWWGAWLNTNPHKVVIVPNRFGQNPVSAAIYPDSWIKIE